jgi:hypothetical protein
MSGQDLSTNNSLTKKNPPVDDPLVNRPLYSPNDELKTNKCNTLLIEPMDDFQRFLQNMAQHADPSK